MKAGTEKKGIVCWVMGISVVMAVFISVAGMESGSGDCIWVELGDDSGAKAGTKAGIAVRGQLIHQKSIARKELVLDFDLSRVKKAEVHYEMICDPYHTRAKRLISKPDENIEWNGGLLILVNGKEAAKGSPVEMATKGWHRIEIKPSLLKQGLNTIDFKLYGIPGYVYLAVDNSNSIKPGRSKASIDGGKTFTTETLNPTHINRKKPSEAMGNRKGMTQGEYMVRLRIGISM